MTDAIFYTAYDDMPPLVRLRRSRRPRQSYGRLGVLWMMAAGATALSALPALSPGSLRGPMEARRIDPPPPLQLAEALPVPQSVTNDPLLLPDYIAGVPAAFSESRPIPSRLIAANAPELAVMAEAAAPTRADVQTAAATEPAISGPKVMADASNEEFDPALPAATTPTTPLLAAHVPLPTPRPDDLAPTVTRPAPFQATRRPLAVASATPVSAPAVSPDNRSFLEKFFGMGQQAKAPASPALGYAAPEDNWFSRFGGGSSRNPTRAYGSGTAVYEIASHTVYLPDGTQLEAHSGLGERLDDPRFVHVRMKGPTPPATYALTLRESLFHGVQALRLTPIDSGVYGRNGLLAHTYMLGPRGDSNGCVSFRDYKSFLRAFQNGVRRLVVVAKLS